MTRYGEAPRTKEFLRQLMECMMTVRSFEERVRQLSNEKILYGTTHLCLGEEATAAGTGMALKSEDYLFVTHRGHGHCIGKGMGINAMMAEMLGKSTGCNGGRGGSMHIADPDKGVLVANGIVSANCPLACGAALSIRMQHIPDRVAAVFFGDGGSNEGAVHEAMNLAAVWQLPVLFLCTDNTYGMSTPFAHATKNTDLTRRALPFDIKTFEVDGNDVLAVYDTVFKARSYILEKSEPAFVVEHTYRTSGHSKSDHNVYRSEEEIAAWRENSPIARFTAMLLENGFTEREIAGMAAEADARAEHAAAYAMECPFPDPAELEQGVYAE